MTYSLGGLIQASDYNGFVSSVNAIWGVGTGNSGYGQSNVLTTVAASNVVTATQWSTLIARINSMRQHQSGVTSGLTSPVAGNVINYLSTMSGQISTCTTNRLLRNVGTSTAATATASGAWNGIWFADRVVRYTWASSNQMRYFFNAGGRVDWNAGGTSLAGNTKSTNWQTVANTAGTQSISSANFYWLPNTFVNLYTGVGSGADYASNTIYLQARVNATPTTSTFLELRVYFGDGSSDSFDDTVLGTAALNSAAYAPLTTYLANTWGTVTGTSNVTVTQG